MLLAIVLAFYWKLTLTNQYTWLDSPDFAYQVLPWYQFQARAWHSGQFPLWAPYEWGGQPLVGQTITGAVYPLNWLVCLLPLRDGVLPIVYLHWYFVLIHYMGALFCFFLCRDLQRSLPASLLGGIAFALAGWFGTTDWPQMINGAAWVPLVFLFLFRVVRGERPKRSAVLAGGFLGLSFLSGHHQIPIFTSVAALFVWVFVLFEGNRLHPRRSMPLLLFGISLALCAALQALPSWEYGHFALRWAGAEQALGWEDRVPYYVHQKYGFYPLSVLGLFIPGMFRNSNGFTGFVIASLAVLALASAWRERAVRFFGALALGALVFSLSSFSIFHGVLYALMPLVEKARNPAMAILMFNLGISVLCAYGIDVFCGNRMAARMIRALLCIGALVFAVLLVCSTVKVPWALDAERAALVALTALLLAAILHGWRNGALQPSVATTLLILLSLTELAQVNGYALADSRKPDSFLKIIPETRDVAAWLKARKEPVRLQVNSEDIQFNFGDWHGLDVFGGYLASLTTNIARTQGPTEVRRLFGVNYYVSKKPPSPSQPQAYAAENGFNVYADPAALPRAWSVHEVTGLPEFPKEYVPVISEPMRRAFVVGTAPILEKCEGDIVSLASRDVNRLTLDADMRCRGMVNVSETYFPGWRATVDGRTAPIHETYGVLRGVVVDAGRHRIEMVYRPATVIWGGILTAVGLAGMAIAAKFLRA